jgi:putative ABC transport system substrate-binding protein
MRRRDLLAALGAAAAIAAPLAARAQQPGLPVVGFLSSLSHSAAWAGAFGRGLAELGYVDGRNVAIGYRWMEGGYDALPRMATDLVQRGAAVIGAFGPPAVVAAKTATSTIPIVFVTGADPVKFGFIASFNRPGGNLTGVWLVTAALAQKRLELVRELAPKAGSIALLVNPKSPVAEPQTRDAQAAADTLGLKLSVLAAATESDFENAFVSLVQQRIDALVVSADPLFASRQDQLVALAAKKGVPAIYEWREFVEAGGLMSYGTVVRDGLQKGGIFAGRILKGANPAELPVEQLNKLELVINLKTAKALGLTVPQTLLARADEVIE